MESFSSITSSRDRVKLDENNQELTVPKLPTEIWILILEMYKEIGKGIGLKELRLVEKRFAELIGSEIQLYLVVSDADSFNCFRKSFTNWNWVKLKNAKMLVKLTREIIMMEESSEMDSK